ncbi:MAG: class SAM-dependent methyltransferase [Frankiales bacterium]|nr:class SAM-dependent methyltransferase [Frankiales bacterium]
MDERRWRERAGSFGAAADVYERSRPAYPVEAVRWLLPTGAQRVLDLGAGTGKLTAVLLDLGLDVVAVEPSEQMRAYVPARAQALAGTAEQVPLPDASVDAVLVGQAFHWFDRGPALAEMARVLRPGGTVGVLWNVRDESAEWVRALGALVGSGLQDSYVLDPAPGLSEPERQDFSYQQSLDADQLVDLVASRSALLTMPEDERVALLQRIRGLAPAEEPFVLPYRTEAWRAVRV